MTKNVGIHLILVFCLWTFHFPFDFFIQGDALFVGIQINISHYWL